MEHEKDIQISILIDFYGKVLKEKQFDIIDCYYNRDLSLSEIADNVGITRQGVLDSIKRSENILYAMEQSIGAVRHSKNLELKVRKIKELAMCIKEESLKLGSDNIKVCAEGILEISQGLCD